MKTENFDEAIRKKLEGLPQKVAEQDVDKVFRFVTRHRGPFYRRIGGHGLIYTALVGLITGLVWWNLSLRNQADNATIPSVNPKTSISQSNTYTQSNQDTNPITQPTRPDDKPQPSAQHSAHKAIDTYAPASTANQNTPNATPDANKEVIADATINEPLLAQPNRNVETNAISPLIAFLQPSQILSVNAIHAKDLPMLKKTSRSISLGTVPKVELAKKTDIKKQKKPDRVNTYKPAKNSSNNRLASSSQRTAKPFFIDLDARVLAGLEINNSQFGAGTQFELIAAKHWGLATGIKYMVNKDEKFRDEQDFFDKKSKHIHQVYGDKPQFDGNMSDIELNTSIVQIPVQFSYYYPFKNGLTVSLAIATGFDVYASSQLRFNNRPGRDSLNHQIDFKAAPSLQTFNNLVVSAGIQKRWNRWAISATPYIGNQLVRVDYRREDWFYGVGVNFSYFLSN